MDADDERAEREEEQQAAQVGQPADQPDGPGLPTHQEAPKDEENKSGESSIGDHLHLDQLPDSILQAVKECPGCAEIAVGTLLQAVTSGSVPGALVAVGKGVASAGASIASRAALIQGGKLLRGDTSSSRGGAVSEPPAAVDADRILNDFQVGKDRRDVRSIGQEFVVKAFSLTDGEIERIVDKLGLPVDNIVVERMIRSFRTRKGDGLGDALKRIIKTARREFQNAKVS